MIKEPLHELDRKLVLWIYNYANMYLSDKDRPIRDLMLMLIAIVRREGLELEDAQGS